DIQKSVQMAIQKPIQKNRDYISQEEADKWKELGLGECLKTKDLDDYMTLCHDLEQYNLEVVKLPTKEELKEEYEKRKLEEIKKRQERPEKDLEFREQEELGMVVKRRAIAVYCAKQFREILEKEFDKCKQFKFALCSLTKFLIDDKPENEKQRKKNSRTDWLRNMQIIVYNKNEIDDYLSSAFEQILYQVEERG
ncbi:34375_t:CDS:2, partial [Racocetra persica]